MMAATIGQPAPQPHDVVLFDGDGRVGWVHDNVVGFHGFGSEGDAAWAAWVAYDAMARRLARFQDSQITPLGRAPMTIVRDGGRHAVLAGRVRIAALSSIDGGGAEADSYGFEIRLPDGTGGFMARSLAHRMWKAIARHSIPHPLRGGGTIDGSTLTGMS